MKAASIFDMELNRGKNVPGMCLNLELRLSTLSVNLVGVTLESSPLKSMLGSSLVIKLDDPCFVGKSVTAVVAATRTP